MKNLEVLNGVQELSNNEIQTIDGGLFAACDGARELSREVGRWIANQFK